MHAGTFLSKFFIFYFPFDRTMKRFYPLLFIAVICSAAGLQGQNLDERLTRVRPSCADIFANAMEVLPELRESNQPDSIAYVINFIERSCEKTLESFNLQVLLAIEQHRFRVEDYYDAGTISNLEKSANGVGLYEAGRSYYPGLTPGKPQAQYYVFTSQWARDLIRLKQLDNNEMLICQVLAGQERTPVERIKNDHTRYPYFFELLKQETIQVRNTPHGIASFVAGYWFPTSNMKILGSHPSFGFQLGVLNKRNEVDLTIQLRVGGTGSTYKVLRDGVIYDLDYYLGGYVGLDYTRYLLKGKNTEFGWLAGIGYDGFDISGESDDDYLSPTSIGSLNVNTGLRFNFYFSARSFVGLQGRYNAVNYKNNGGSSFKGDSFSIDLIIGGSTR